MAVSLATGLLPPLLPTLAPPRDVVEGGVRLDGCVAEHHQAIQMIGNDRDDRE
jgi:hypothetical protein